MCVCQRSAIHFKNWRLDWVVASAGTGHELAGGLSRLARGLMRWRAGWVGLAQASSAFCLQQLVNLSNNRYEWHLL